MHRSSLKVTNFIQIMKVLPLAYRRHSEVYSSHLGFMGYTTLHLLTWFLM